MHSLSTIFASFLLGSMILFAAIVIPLVFHSLDDNNSLKFTRRVFPTYYLWGAAISALALVFALGSQSYVAIPMVIVLAGFLYSRHYLIEKLIKAKDRWLTSCSAQDKSVYQSLHKRSVIINAVQMSFLLLIVVEEQVL